MQVQQIPQVDFVQMEADIQEIKLGLLEALRIENPEAYVSFSKEINSQQQIKS